MNVSLSVVINYDSSYVQPKKIQFRAEKNQFTAEKFHFSVKKVQFSAKTILI